MSQENLNIQKSDLANRLGDSFPTVLRCWQISGDLGHLAINISGPSNISPKGFFQILTTEF